MLLLELRTTYTMPTLPDAAQDRFLEAFVESHGDSEIACQTASVSRAVFYRWLREDEIFRGRFDQYRLALSEEIENEAVRRVLKPEGQRGSDALVTTLMKGLKRERYGQDDVKPGPAAVIYISGLREQPRPGLPEGEKNDGSHREGSGDSRQPVEGDRVLDAPWTPSSGDRDQSGSARGDAPAGKSTNGG